MSRAKHAWRIAVLGLAAAVTVSPLRAEASEPATVLDRFDDLSPWKAAASDGVNASIERAQGVDGAALRLDFDLGGTAGYATASRALALDLPPNYELLFRIRGDAPVNDLQIKLVDASGDNVWWFHRRNYEFPREWQRVAIKKRQIEFAWGPAKDHELRHAARIELVVAAGRGGGSGSIYVSDLVLRELPMPPARWPAPVGEASSSLPGAEAALALDGNVATAWLSDPAAGGMQTYVVDLGCEREFGGLIVRWKERAFASRYDVQFSEDGVRWTTVRTVSQGRGGPDALLTADAQTRFVRLVLRDGPAKAYGIAEVEIEDIAFGASPNAFFEALARDSPRGSFPRGFSGEQAYWTIVGVDGGADSGLLSEDGALEVGSGGFSIEPFVVADSRVTTWADVETTQSLEEGYLPIPSVSWQHSDWQLRTTAFASGTRGQSRLIARYELSNSSDRPLSLRLVLAVRPFQVNPPAQFLNVEGGVSGIRGIAWDDAALIVDGARRIYPLRTPDRVGMAPFDAGSVVKWAAAVDWPAVRTVHDAFGYASAALDYAITLAPHAGTTVSLVVPLSGAAAPPELDGKSMDAWVADAHDLTAQMWRDALGRVSFDVPEAAQPLIDTLRTALAHLLIIRDGPILRPGTRSYARSWIRDGAMMSESLLRLGHADVAADYLRWFAPRQFVDGKIPCCVDARGADPVAENDSDGEFVVLVDSIYRHTHDRALLESMWPHVVAAMRHLEALRQAGRIDANRVLGRRPFYGLVPASISHEGYSAKPMHSYWDDYWALKGYDAALNLAQAYGNMAEADRWRAARDEFREELRMSLHDSMAAHHISYLPGAAELGDFDPTSTAIAFAPGDAVLDPASALVRATYDRYWREFLDRRDGRMVWDAYTPYEIRTVGTFVRLGWRERAHELLAFFLASRRPAAWNQWAEVVGNQYRQPRFIGDMPHGWVESDFIRAVLDLFAYERSSDRSIVLGRGIPPEWLASGSVAIRELRTPYGLLSYSLRKDRGRVILEIDARSGLPPGGFVFIAPRGKRPPTATLNGTPANWQDGELRLLELPAKLVVNPR
jgi:F5/8 type C domain